MISTDCQPSLPSFLTRSVVFALPALASSMTISLPSACLARQRRLQRQLADLLRQAVFMAAHDRTEDAGAAAELRRTQAALAGVAGALLGLRLLGRALDVADVLGLVVAGPALGELPVHRARQDVLAHAAGRRPRRRDRFRRRSCCRDWSPDSFMTGYSFFSAAALRRRREWRPGTAHPSAASRFTASRIRTKPPSRARHRAADQDDAAVRIGRDDLQVLAWSRARRPDGRPSSCSGRCGPDPGGCRSNHGCGARPTRRGWRAGRRSSSASSRRRSPCRWSCR